MKRREFITLLGGAALTWPLAVRAQQSGKIYTIGLFTAGSLEELTMMTAVLPDALRELGWIEGKNVAYERRYANNRLERLPELAAELVRLDVDVIVAIGISRHLRLSRLRRRFRLSWRRPATRWRAVPHSLRIRAGRRGNKAPSAG